MGGPTPAADFAATSTRKTDVDAAMSVTFQPEPGKAVKNAIDNQCGLLEPSTDYTEVSDLSEWSDQHENVYDPRACCGLCVKDERCKAFSLHEWVESKRGPVCYLKGGHVVQRTHRAGVVSGLPPQEGVRNAQAAAVSAIESVG